MRARILDFVQALRARDVDVSVAEALDAVQAVAAAGVEREVLREALAASLVKDEADRPAFDALFDVMFPAGAGDDAGAPGRRRARRGGADGGDGGRRAPGSGTGSGGRSMDEPAARAGAAWTPRATEPRDPRAGAGGEHGTRLTRRAAARRALLARPLRELAAGELDEARALARALGNRLRTRLLRRARPARRGRLDFRRTIRAATASGGVPVRPRFRTRRPARPDLVALCDVSGSVAAATELLLGLLAPTAGCFRRTHLFAYVDRLCPASLEEGHLALGGRLDLHARSDFGRVLADLAGAPPETLGRTTLLLVLGDARNNRLPPRVDLLRAVRDRVQRLVWLVPEPRVRWDTGDSVLGRYAPLCDAVFECVDLGALVAAVRAVF